MLTRLKIGPRLAMAFGVLTLLLVASAIVGLVGLSNMKETADSAINTDAALAQNALNVQRLALEERRFEKDSFINIDTPDRVAGYYDKWENSRAALSQTLAEGEQLAPTDDLRQLYTQAEAALEAYAAGFQAIHQRIVNGELTEPAQANAAFGAYKEQVYQLESLADQINTVAAERMDRANETISAAHSRTMVSLLVFAAIALLAAVALAVVITRSITRPLGRALYVAEQVAQGDLTQEITVTGRDETAQLLAAMKKMNASLLTLVGSIRETCQSVHAGASELSHASHDLAARTEQQAASLEETAASMEEISSTVKNNTEATQRINALTIDATGSARSSSSDVVQSLSLMKEIATQSQRVNEILATIDSISFQTNILALNASVEAARAGEQGRGFAVVASEVRALANRSATSAGEIRQLLETMSQRITSGVAQAERSGGSIEQTRGAIEELATLINEIATASREQNGGVDQVNTAIAQMDMVTQQNAAMVEQSTAAASMLEEQAGQLQKLVATFRIRETAHA
ncbi:methyl-accepting chemotaxis protein [Kushneria indalinina]|uniref:Methyl-accepting chemotaxis protein n=1 Tax=Kushneria indalinina DSM 14324 TaxID=1122140 RepID=A0A3D9DVX6_9GAMM|nr:methyl-accepting chemotaxis protein [Kushneria indalinina]REC94922.1 methyl-accepting chemotaxis protein [Kushneria indalinina DSM 14324]